jgi:CheY-like chemotaxis protein/anti-sigma regulatory factor (Ser/Thr protein kinase)
LIDLNEVVSEAVRVLQPVAQAKGVRVRVELQHMSDGVYGDPARLQQVVWNLLSNAVKFTRAHGTVDVQSRRTAQAIEVSVADTGQGIAPEFLPSVFEPFRQADASSTRSHPGLGLGLSIVKTLVEAHQGTVTAQSAGEGHGATFTVRLPAVALPGSPDPAAGPPAVADGEVPSLAGVSVLVVDDDHESREVVAAHLLHLGARVMTATSAQQAFELLQKEPVHVLLADIGMPGEDGYSLIRRIRALGVPEVASVPAAALTALARKEDRQQALQAGFQLHLAKPVDSRLLAAAVTSLHRLNFA